MEREAARGATDDLYEGPTWTDFREHYGIRVAYLDEDGGMIALGHHNPRRVVAAFNRHSRHDSIWINMADDSAATYRDVVNALGLTRVAEDLSCGACADYDDGCSACYAVRDRRLSGDITVWDAFAFSSRNDTARVVAVTGRSSPAGRLESRTFCHGAIRDGKRSDQS